MSELGALPYFREFVAGITDRGLGQNWLEVGEVPSCVVEATRGARPQDRGDHGSGHRLRLQITTRAPTLLAPTRPQVAALSGGRFSIARNSHDPSYINLPVLPLNAFPRDPAYAHTSYTDEPQSPGGIGSSTMFLGPQFKIPPLGK